MKIEGYWYSKLEPQFPMPVADTIDMRIKDQFIEKLKAVQKLSREYAYRGFSGCRICNCLNGTKEHEFRDWRWPEGYLHYIRDHNVAPSQEFFDFIMNV